jgi:multidrug transporter EmrE-like cation transporter
MSPVTRAVTLAILLSGVGVAAASALKVASLKRSPFTSVWFVIGCGLALAFAVVWIHVVQHMKLATAGLIYGVVSTFMLVLIGSFCFGERLSASEITGVGMAMVAMLLLGRV